MYEVTVESKFSGQHALRHYKGVGEELHSHTWSVKVAMKGSRLFPKSEYLIDFVSLKGTLGKILKKYSGKNLNSVTPFNHGREPSAENLAKIFYDQLKRTLPPSQRKLLHHVTVWESPDCAATYYPS